MWNEVEAAQLCPTLCDPMKNKSQLFPLYNNKTDVFSEFVQQFFGVFVETA